MTPAAFKRSIRDLQVWCSSCMVAFSGSDPIGVLIGAKRPSGTLVHKIAVHPDHRRQGHGRHLLTSLGSKLAILGPPRIIAEVPETLAPACELFSASGYVQEALLTDYVLRSDVHERARRRSAESNGFVIPVTVDDLAANGLLGERHPQVCWERSVETLTAQEGRHRRTRRRLRRANRGLPPLRHVWRGTEQRRTSCRFVAWSMMTETAWRSCCRDSVHGDQTIRFPKVHPDEVPSGRLESLGFHPAAVHRALRSPGAVQLAPRV